MAIKVLVVEDDAFLLKAYMVKLQNSGFDVQSATDGEEAISALKSFSPDIILLDLVMPRKDGFQTLQEIRQIDDFKSTPIFVVSNLGQQEELDRAKELGATDLLLKSNLSMSDLIDKINKTVGKK